MSTKNTAYALFPRSRLLTLKELVLTGKKPVHLRELARRTGLDPTGLGRELKNLELAGIVSVNQSGNQKEYILNPACPIHDELVMMILKTAGLADELRAALNPLRGNIIKAYIYGSFASGRQKFDSDVDLMVVGNVSLKEVVKAVAETGRKLSREINPTVLKPDEYRDKLKDPGSFPGRIEGGPVIHLLGEENGA